MRQMYRDMEVCVLEVNGYHPSALWDEQENGL